MWKSRLVDSLFFQSNWWGLCFYLPQPLTPASVISFCVMCACLSVGQSECQQWRRVQGIGRLLATAVPLVGTDPAGSLWVGEHKWRCVWGVVATNDCAVIATTTTTAATTTATATVAGHEARPAWRRLARAIERTRKLYLLHYPWLRLLLRRDRRLSLCRNWMSCVGRWQIESVLLHSQAHAGDRLHGLGRELGLDWEQLWRRALLGLLLVRDLAVGLVGHQDKLQALLLLLKLGDLSFQLCLLLLQYVCLLWMEGQDKWLGKKENVRKTHVCGMLLALENLIQIFPCFQIHKAALINPFESD